MATRHDRRSISGALFSAGHAGTDEPEALFAQVLASADRVDVLGVTAVDDDVARLQQRNQLLDETVHRRSGYLFGCEEIRLHFKFQKVYSRLM